MEALITKKPSGNSQQRRQAWRAFQKKYTSLGYDTYRKKNFKGPRSSRGKTIPAMFIARIKD